MAKDAKTNPVNQKVNLFTQSSCRSAPKWSLVGKSAISGKVVMDTVPGPGKYGWPGYDSRKARSPSFGFGGAARPGQEKKVEGGPGRKWKIPGPGEYMPDNPNKYLAAPRWGFGSEARIPKLKEKPTAPPGAYKISTDLVGPGKTMHARMEAGKSSSEPGPGAYMPQHTQTKEAKPCFSFGSGERTEDPIERERGRVPGPGTYTAVPGGRMNFIAHSSQKYSFQSRRPMQKSESTPALVCGHYTQFEN